MNINYNQDGSVEVTETSGFKPIVLEFQPEVVCGYTYVYPPPKIEPITIILERSNNELQ